MKLRKPSPRIFLSGNFQSAYTPTRRPKTKSAAQSPSDSPLMDRMLTVRAERRAERRNQYATNIEVGLIAALLVTLLAFQLPISSTSPSGWIQERLEAQQMAQAELPPRPVIVEPVEDVILEAEPVTLDATLELDGTALHQAHRSTNDRTERPSAALR